jgi:inner membrane protein
MIEYLAQIEFWHWWVLAVLLVTLEILAPSTVLLWPGISAAIVGIILLFADTLGWETQFLIFAVLSVVSLLGWRAYAKTLPVQDGQPGLNRRGQQYVGRSFTLTEPIVNGRGKLNIDDTIWSITGENLDAGTKIKVTGIDGNALNIEKT